LLTFLLLLVFPAFFSIAAVDSVPVVAIVQAIVGVPDVVDVSAVFGPLLLLAYRLLLKFECCFWRS
jgi:hypothetical protein